MIEILFISLHIPIERLCLNLEMKVIIFEKVVFCCLCNHWVIDFYSQLFDIFIKHSFLALPDFKDFIYYLIFDQLHKSRSIALSFPFLINERCECLILNSIYSRNDHYILVIILGFLISFISFIILFILNLFILLLYLKIFYSIL